MKLEGSILAAPAVMASSEWVSLRMRVGAASFGLITASAMLVHLWGGVTEAHFHFFVMIGVLTLYQDWMPFLIAIGYVVVHHGVMGVLAPHQVYSTPDAALHPWRWALIHGGFVLAASAAHIVVWRTNENQLLRDPLTALPSRLLFTNRLSQALERLQRRRGSHVAVLFLDTGPLQGHQRQPRPPRRRQADRRGRRAPAPRAAPARDDRSLGRRRVAILSRTSSTTRRRSRSASAG